MPISDPRDRFFYSQHTTIKDTGLSRMSLLPLILQCKIQLKAEMSHRHRRVLNIGGARFRILGGQGIEYWGGGARGPNSLT